VPRKKRLEVIIPDHAATRMDYRGINEEDIAATVEKAERREVVEFGFVAFYKRIKNRRLVVITKESGNSLEVVTVYWE
jgi:hypothetical protein